MPKPVKPAAKKRPSSDPNRRAKQLLDEHMAKFEASEKPPAPSFQEQLSAHMAQLGRKGGTIGGKRRLDTLSPKRRKEIARLAAQARWRNNAKHKGDHTRNQLQYNKLSC
jgi:hypothetical protein